MIKAFPPIVILLFLFLLVSCGGNSNQAVQFFDEPQDTLQLNLSREFGKDLLVTSYSSKWHNIETTGSAKIKLDTGIMAILDNVMGEPYLHLYNSETGELLNSLENKKLSDLALCQKTNRLAILYNDNTVEIRDYQLELISSHQLQGVVTEMSLIDHFLITGKWPKSKGPAGYIITERLNLKNDSITPLLFLEPALKSKYRRVKAYTSAHESTITMAPFISNNLFYLNADGSKNEFQIDFGNRQPDLNALSNSSKDTYDFTRENNWVYGIDEIISTDQYLYLTGLIDTKIFQMIVDRESLNVKTVSLRNDVPISHNIGNQFAGLYRRANKDLKQQNTTNYNQLKVNRYELVQ